MNCQYMGLRLIFAVAKLGNRFWYPPTDRNAKRTLAQALSLQMNFPQRNNSVYHCSLMNIHTAYTENPQNLMEVFHLIHKKRLLPF